MRPLTDRFLCPDDWPIAEQEQSDPQEGMRAAAIAGVCLSAVAVIAGVAIVAWLA